MTFDPPLRPFAAAHLTNGVFRPLVCTNAWAAAADDASPAVTLAWPTPTKLSRVDLHFDADFDHAMETVLLGHPERVVPFCVRQYRLVGIDAAGGEQVLAEVDDNRIAHRHHVMEPMELASLRIELTHPSATTPAALMGVRCYA